MSAVPSLHASSVNKRRGGSKLSVESDHPSMDLEKLKHKVLIKVFEFQRCVSFPFLVGGGAANSGP